MRILGIETSCDETSAALLEFRGDYFRILSNVIFSSVKLHAKYGGIVPEVAARKQMENIMIVLGRALKKRISNSRYSIVNIQRPDYICVTNGPGLITSLRVGVETAKALSYAWTKPLVAVNHLEGHIYANAIFDSDTRAKASTGRQFLALNKIQTPRLQIPKWKFPVLALIVSGGHTQLVLMKDHLKYRVIGETQDDAAGEAFDKVAKILGLSYPGGPEISRLVKKGDATKVDLPRPMINSGDYNFSFSGIKTAVLYKTIEKKIRKEDMCASFQEACVNVLVNKTIKAAVAHNAKMIILGGGVAANERLRALLKYEVCNKLCKTELLMPDIGMAGDNAAMIAFAGYYRIKNKMFSDWRKIRTEANLRLDGRSIGQ
ncbi:tRNA (adenosine(37)-N6)-threonylcarbamoyltransferase complex transferase subunit TsaD [Candidatus Kuenenbacteria bacterium CG11_big_fil_rev_8_21_14_0_20_37_9]|uniref:tRNA N6-adenosine threonylcarbamoyltransferase n=2 Tax=Candidatus Kueneniibacteriota TaxID=1752740 RepID=A0A2M6XRY1_9BACT|nr:MAG: tRNA (adenosine(37)-N6)-threonylcarbamoyltransferase complex transferase subunit TsaD [Candidatus Kuenenbacteria bacterium CG1_02_38_13]PIR05745.1 MAG: tRNA (adenosine(37)-N6)-threonylcarbamoyltransferase complex transferase subunit TsaD [Candidatus Kuenenbacteria bacterium CG11_big_fil_rev_8_21_14_0_20_37_9]PIU10361.1 MAG: tRNA (adenosine(37)-N6)-threonylcarbamoyltransferase complex transferase subunit TsaD [Candidatus Kuenenbacteria bacterium CG08_land_8_20_14_0_20_37_23]